jgi:hypothetical protein
MAPGKQSVNVKGIGPGIMQIKATMPKNTGSVTVSFTARTGGGGATNPLGGGGKPFAPTLLAKFGNPITWDPKSKTGHDADAKADAGNTATAGATVEVPEGVAGTVYVQIANSGDNDGAYDSIAIAFKPRAGTADGDAGDPNETPGGGKTTRVVEEGCSAAAASPASSSSEKSMRFVFPGILLALGGLTAWRRRHARRRVDE